MSSRRRKSFFRAAGFEEVQVDDLQVPGGVGDAEYLQVGHAFLPAGAIAQAHDGGGKGCGETAQPRDGQGEESHVAPVDAHQLLGAVAQAAEDGEGDLVNHVAEHRGAHGRQLGTILVPGQGGRAEYLADEEDTGVDVGRIEQAGGSQPAACVGKLAQSTAAAMETRFPRAEKPEKTCGEYG